ncbi:uncharacterized protein LOC127813598 isoform X2 [Diospyros lotus]|uniref:uncharacterized protein LOC127813598 isoform X2 n=1 Tax=Diospyros lotus TaxID=55363 RepID=UPI00224D34B4|nr:uncharacterized protein LOC127813598 isoform X2 [Diospyros lotus]
MAAQAHDRDPQPPVAVDFSNDEPNHEKLLCSYLGLTFGVFLGLTLQSRNGELYLKLVETEEQLRELLSRRKEDSKANARVVEIFATHRHAWHREEKRLLHQIDAGADEITRLRARVEELEKTELELSRCVDELRREVGERDEMLNFMARPSEFEDCPDGGGGGGYGGECCSEAAVGLDPVPEECLLEREGHNMEEMGVLYRSGNGFSPEFLSSASKFWAQKTGVWQDPQYESLESLHHLKHFSVRRESPWKVDGEATGVSSKLKLLEQELLNLERIDKSNLSKVPSQMRKQAKRYQALAGKIDDLCRRMASDPSEPTLSSEFRTQRQTEFLLEAFRLQQRASETAQKLMALQTETGKSYLGGGLEAQAQLTTRRCMDSIKNNFREIQRNLEIWLARIIGDLEGILARDGASRVGEYYLSGYPFVQ